MKSKTLTTWLALLGGSIGAHRLYLRGPRGLLDIWVWLHCSATLLGLIGLYRVRASGLDDPAAWLLIPFGGLSISAAMLAAIVNGLQGDEVWHQRHNPGNSHTPGSGWANVIGVGLALLIGAIVLMSTITVSLQHYFEA
ncbi:MAG: hypothetical protein RL375_2408 [Pseudomonadota bacterium]